MKKLTLFTLILSFLLTPLSSLAAADTNPYCSIGRDYGRAKMLTKYYYYGSDGRAHEDTNRRLAYAGEQHKQLTVGNDELILSTQNQTAISPSWTTSGKYAIWCETDDTAWAYKYSSKKKFKIATDIGALNLNDRNMVTSVTLQNGKEKKIGTLINNPLTSPVKVQQTADTAEESTYINEDGSLGDSSKLSWLPTFNDAAGRVTYTFGKHTVIVDDKIVYYDEYCASEYCDSNTRFVGISPEKYLYLYEDSTNQYYRFKPNNIPNPKKLYFAKKTKFKSIKTVKGWMTKIVTSKGTFDLSQLVVDAHWYSKKDTVINKYGYCIYYLRQQDKKHKLTVKNKKLYFNGKLIAKKISRETEGFGFKKNSIWCVRSTSKGAAVYKASISKPKKFKFVQYGTRFGYNTKTGFICKIYK